MKAVVWHGVSDIRLDTVPSPRIEQPSDALVRLTASAICGTDLHFVRGSVACGYCAYCRAGYYSQCDNANPNGKDAGTAFYGGPKETGPFHGLQAEYARIPFANVGLVKLPDAETAMSGPAAGEAQQRQSEFARQVEQEGPHAGPDSPYQPGQAPSQALQWAVKGLCKAGTLAIIGVYPQTAQSFPIGMAMNKNLTIQSGNCNHRKYLPHLIDLVQNGTLDPTRILTELEPLTGALDAYQAFNARQPGWIKVELDPTSSVSNDFAVAAGRTP